MLGIGNYSEADLREEIESRCINGGRVGKDALLQSILDKHPAPTDLDEDYANFAAFFIHRGISQAVDKYFREIKHKEEVGEDPQMILPGYEYLQKRYIVTTEDAESEYVPHNEMSDEELEAKAQEHEAMGRGHFAHAEEIRRYIRDRRKKIS